MKSHPFTFKLNINCSRQNARCQLENVRGDHARAPTGHGNGLSPLRTSSSTSNCLQDAVRKEIGDKAAAGELHSNRQDVAAATQPKRRRWDESPALGLLAAFKFAHCRRSACSKMNYCILGAGAVAPGSATPGSATPSQAPKKRIAINAADVRLIVNFACGIRVQNTVF